MRSANRIFIVDDHPLVLNGLRQLIEREPDMEVCGEAGGTEQAISLIRRDIPHLAIIDISMPDGNGLQLIPRIHSINPVIRILVSSMHDESLLAERSLKAGAMGYINKSEAAENVVLAIRTILDGNIWLSKQMKQQLLPDGKNNGSTADNRSVECLSNRELEIFDLIGRGMRTGEIADKLSLSVKTVETHRANIKAKLNLGSSGELSRRAMQWSLKLE
ncbi:MAG: response regulator transcription factor [Thiotrichales bacterium]|nr:MAG: response regulator transcription factor [Thiotrichales bacterium]